MCNKRLEKEIITEIVPKLWETENIAEVNPFRTNPEEEEQEKMTSFTNELTNEWPNGTILIVGHAEWIRRWTKMYQKNESNLGNCESVSVIL